MLVMCGPFDDFFFLFAATATPLFYTLSLHDALPIFLAAAAALRTGNGRRVERQELGDVGDSLDDRFRGDPVLLVVGDRKSTRLNSSHVAISYAVFCLKKKIRD